MPKSFGVVSNFNSAFNRLTVAQSGVWPERKAAVTAAVGRFVPVYDYHGALLAKPGETRHEDSAISCAISIDRHFSSICKRCCCWWLSWHVPRVLPASATEVPNIKPL